MENTLVRTERCQQCGEVMLWTQNVWRAGGAYSAAYQCPNGHLVDPAETRQCPQCGIHDTELTGTAEGRQQFKCHRCGEAFQIPR
jgi:predicted RNA-binding Zn-ribbon protein involved in translation (DUF1610 family)